MGKLEAMRRELGGYIAESMGVGRDPYGPIALAPQIVPPPPAERARGAARSRSTMEVPIEKIDRDRDQPREEFDDEALNRLAESLKARGQLQPIRVRWDEGGGVYLIICGERRWRAAKLAGLATLTAVVHEGPIDASELLAIQMIENCLREDLRPVEQARAYRRLMEAHGWTAGRVAQELHLSPAQVSKVVAILELPEPVQALVDAGRLAATTAYEIGKADGPEEQVELAGRAVAERLTREDVREAVKAKVGARSPGKTRRDRVEYHDGGTTVIVAGEAVAAGRGGIVAALERALERARGDSVIEAA